MPRTWLWQPPQRLVTKIHLRKKQENKSNYDEQASAFEGPTFWSLQQVPTALPAAALSFWPWAQARTVRRRRHLQRRQRARADASSTLALLWRGLRYLCGRPWVVFRPWPVKKLRHKNLKMKNYHSFFFWRAVEDNEGNESGKFIPVFGSRLLF